MFQAARIATSGHTITGRKCLYDADGRFEDESAVQFSSARFNN